MPNIMLVGFPFIEAESLRMKIEDFLRGRGLYEETVITVFFGEVVSVYLGSPYLVLRDTDPKRLDDLAVALNETFNVDVEYELLRGFLPKKS